MWGCHALHRRDICMLVLNGVRENDYKRIMHIRAIYVGNLELDPLHEFKRLFAGFTF